MTEYLALCFLALFTVVLAYADISSKRLYKKIIGEGGVPDFYNRIKFFKKLSRQNHEHKQQINNILQAYNACIVVIGIVFILYVLGNIF